MKIVCPLWENFFGPQMAPSVHILHVSYFVQVIYQVILVLLISEKNIKNFRVYMCITYLHCLVVLDFKAIAWKLTHNESSA